MSWQTPKTNWKSEFDLDGNYIGDWFGASDFNRIKNNLEYLKDLANTMYPAFTINDLGSDRTYGDYGPYADEINSLEENLYTINENTTKKPEYQNYPTYSENGIIMDAEELNRIESATLDIYNILNNQYIGRRMLTWRLGAPNSGYLHGM
ncbi:MAG: hypothetical protein IK072_01955 [Clostridia bacterium]|nr:hypothetical protein [Clostridia bacterium]